VSTLAAEHTARRLRQQQVEALITELDERRRELYHLNARGVQRAGLRDVKREFLEVRRQLSNVLAAQVDSAAHRASPEPVQLADSSGLGTDGSWPREAPSRSALSSLTAR
jgi:hypothetical protein